jgi:hypothetical protein
MPEISRFLGISILMHFKEHNPPRFHATYNEYKATISIDPLQVTNGKLPARVLGLVIEWATMHRQELLENWQALCGKKGYSKIAPLA